MSRPRRAGDNVCDLELERLRRRGRGRRVLPMWPRLRGRGIVVAFPRRWRMLHGAAGTPDLDPAS